MYRKNIAYRTREKIGCVTFICVNKAFVLSLYQSQVLKTIREKAFETIMGKGENTGNQISSFSHYAFVTFEPFYT